ncbi:outer membrane protein, nutrient binding [Filimonas lacunae]|nr:outer membrane protein, nutrient binding [Filimonas lacunae]
MSLWVALMSIAWASVAQTKSISGKVVDGNNVPIEGASIQVKGSTRGTIADGQGLFTISAASADILVITSTNFAPKEVKVGNQTNIIVSLVLQSSTIDEVVVTALGVSRQKKSLGYSVQNVTADKLTEGGNPNLATALQGKVAGMEVRPSSGMPGASAQIFIRGARFFDGNNSPLYVVDGLPVSSQPDFEVGGNGVTGSDYSGRSIDINPNDIESISVLKGQAASALYGTRASNGVIMITTKSGKRLKKGAPVVNFSTNWQFDNISRKPELQQLYAQGSGGGGNFSPTASTSWGPLISELPNDVNYGGNVPNSFNNNNPTAETQGKYWNPKKGAWVVPQAYDNIGDFFKTGLVAANNLSISQASDLGSYYVGFGSTNQTGIMPASKMNRYNVKFSGDFNVSSKVKVGASVNYSTVAIYKMPSGNNSLLFEIYGAPVSYDLKGTPISEANNPYKQIQYRGGTFDNPYWGAQYNRFIENTRRVLGNTYISYSPIQPVTIKWQVGVDQYTTDREELFEYGSGPAPTGDLTNGALTNRTFNSQFTASFNKQVSQDWHINALVGNEVNDNYLRNIVGSGTGFILPGFDNIGNATTQLTSESKFKTRTVGFYGQAGADWRNMVFLTVTGRNDYISTMPRGSRSFFYPSASLAWAFTELEPLKNKGFYGKLRASIAQVGSPGTYKEKYYTRHTSGSGFLSSTNITFPFNGVIGFRPNSTLYATDLKPQNTNSLEVGVELSFFKNRVSVDYSYTTQKTKDQIFSIPLAGSTGFAQIVRNAGEMQSNAHEVTLRVVPVKTNYFQWDVSANFTKVLSKVNSLATGVDNIYLGGFTDPQVRAAIGYSYPSIFGTTYLRNDKGQIRVDASGMPLTGSDGVIGTVTPDFNLDINNGLRYKFMQLNILLAWKKGGQMYSGANRLINLYGTSKLTENRATDKILVQGVKESTVVDGKGGDVNDIVISGAPALYTYYNSKVANISEANIYGTSFVKFREIALSFDLPRSLLQKTGFIKSAAFSVSARNILLWTELPNFDPESSQGNGNMQGGFDYMSLPQARSIGLGLNLTF